MKPFILFFALSLLFSLRSFAQSDKALYKKYEYGKSFLNNKQYAQSFEVFKSLSSIEYNNRYRAYALYFYALSAYHIDRKDETRNILFEILKKYPDWKDKDDVYFLLGRLDFEKRSFASGLENFSKIKSNVFETEILQSIETEITDLGVDDLEFLYRKYQYEILGEKLFAVLQQVNIYPLYEKLYTELQPKYGGDLLIGDSLGILEKDIVYKDEYNVAVMLPFQYQKFDIDSVPTNQQAVFDLYEGIRLAATDLSNEGMKLNLYVFDTQKDSLKAIEILSDTAFSSMDLIIGPLYPSTIVTAGDYAGLFKKVMVNPVSSNTLIINGNPFAFLTAPTGESQAEQIVDFAFDSLNSKQAFIIHGLKKTDEEIAQFYQSYLQERGGEVMLFQPFEYDKKFFSNLQSSLELLADDTIPHVFVSSSDPVVASNVISALQNLKSRSVIFAPDAWLNYSQFSFEQLEKMKVHFVHPRYIDEDAYGYRKFRSNYVKKMNLVPSLYACLGYESMYFFGKNLHKYGSGLYVKIHEEAAQKGKIFPVLDYQKGNDNSFAPILRFKNGSLKMLNSIDQVDILERDESLIKEKP